MLPIYHMPVDSPPAHFVHVIDVVSIEYARKFNLVELHEVMIRLKAKRAVRTAESQLAIWVPRGGIDNISLLDERVPPANRHTSILVHNNGSHFATSERADSLDSICAA